VYSHTMCFHCPNAQANPHRYSSICMAEHKKVQDLLLFRRKLKDGVSRSVPKRKLNTKRGLQIAFTDGKGTYSVGSDHRILPRLDH
jgi:hypothetical protein